MTTYVDAHGYVCERGRVIGRTSPEHAGRSVSRGQYRRARGAREAARLPATDPSKSKKIKVRIGTTDSGQPIYREVDIDEAAKAFREGGKEAVAKRFGRAAAERMRFRETPEGLRIRYVTDFAREEQKREAPLDVAFQREQQLRERKVPREAASAPLDVAFQREAWEREMRDWQRKHSGVIEVHRHEGVLGRWQQLKEVGFERWQKLLGGSRYYAEKSAEAAKVLALPAAEGYAAVKLLGWAERGAAVMGTKGAQLFEAGAAGVKSGMLAGVLTRAAQVSRALPWGVRGAGVGFGGVSMVIAGGEARKALKEGDTERALKIVAATAAAGAGSAVAARGMPSLPTLKQPSRQPEYLITYLRGIKEYKTLTAWQEGSRIKVLESREVTPQFTTERVPWKPEKEPEGILLRVHEKTLRAEFQEGKLTALKPEERKFYEFKEQGIKGVPQLREITTMTGKPDETGVMVLEREVMVERTGARKEPPERAPLPGELAERIPERPTGGRSGSKKPSMPYEPPGTKPKRELPSWLREGKGRKEEELPTADISRVEADVRRLQRVQRQRGGTVTVLREPVMREPTSGRSVRLSQIHRTIQEYRLREPAVVGVRRLQPRGGRNVFGRLFERFSTRFSRLGTGIAGVGAGLLNIPGLRTGTGRVQVPVVRQGQTTKQGEDTVEVPVISETVLDIQRQVQTQREEVPVPSMPKPPRPHIGGPPEAETCSAAPGRQGWRRQGRTQAQRADRDVPAGGVRRGVRDASCRY